MTAHSRSRGSYQSADALVIGVLVLLAAIPHLGSLGFYSDDWGLLSQLVHSSSSSLGGLVRELVTAPENYSHGRPTHFALLAALYRLFGLHPFWYHLVGTLVVASTASLVYLSAREISHSRSIAIAIALVFGLAPQYSSARIWVTAIFNASVSMAFYALSLYASIRFMRSRRTGQATVWFSVAIGAALISVSSYEVALPLLLLHPLLAGIAARSERGDLGHRFHVRLVMVAVSVIVIVAVAALYKLGLTTRIHAENHLGQQLIANLRDVFTWADRPLSRGLSLRGILRIHGWTFGLALPLTVARALSYGVGAGVLFWSLVVGVSSWWLMDRALRSEPWPMRSTWLAAGGVGLMLLLGGYAIFITNRTVLFTPTGISNRMAIAGTLGSASFAIGMAGYLCSLWRSVRLSRLTFCAIVAILSAAGTLLLGWISGYWAQAWHRQAEILSVLEQSLPADFPRDGTLLLGGACPSIGPAPVFEAPWGLSGALQITLGGFENEADVITSQTVPTGEGVWSSRWGERLYPYSPKLFVFDLHRRSLEPLTSPRLGREVVGRLIRESEACPTSYPGTGVPLLVRLPPVRGVAVLVELHPSHTAAGRPFQVQPGGDSALAVSTRNARPQTVISWDGRPLKTTYASDRLLTALVPRDAYSVPGKHRVELIGAGGPSNALFFQVDSLPEKSP